VKKATSAQTRSLLASLYDPVSFRQSATRHKIQTLAQVVTTGEAAALPDLAPLLLDSNVRVAQAAADTIHALLKTLRPTDYAWLDQLMRIRSPYRWSASDEWFTLKKSGVARLQSLGDSSVVALGMATFHSSGYVRQEAVRRLASAHDGAELPFLILRLNDWVVPIRITADLLIRERLTAKYADSFAANLSLLQRVWLTQRGQYSGIQDSIASLLTSEVGTQAIRRGLTSDDLEVRRACYKFAFQFACLDPAFLLEQALRTRDPAVRVLAIQKGAELPNAVLKPHLERAGRDSYPPVRRKALEISADRFPAEAQVLLDKTLLDPHPSVRGYAQFRMATDFTVDLAEFYRRVLADPDSATLYAAISGLGETGAAKDAGLILPHVSAPLPRIRRAALRAMARLQPEPCLDIFKTYLLDESPSVSREAMKALSKLTHLLTGEQLWTTFMGTSTSRTQQNILFLIARLSKWESIAYLIRAVAANEDRVSALARRYIERWSARFNSSFTLPTTVQVQRLSETLDSHILLPREVQDQIRFGISR